MGGEKKEKAQGLDRGYLHPSGRKKTSNGRSRKGKKELDSSFSWLPVPESKKESSSL